jgi:hypothetical protein
MSDASNPLETLDRQELLWLAGILKDACRERLEKNLVSQALEERLYRRGPVAGRLDPRPFLRIWELRYRKFLEVATELHAQLESEDARKAAAVLTRRRGGTEERRRPILTAGTPRRRGKTKSTPDGENSPLVHQR